MTSGYILIVAILILGGVIATVGDRLGTKVGKARLSLFNLRPRQTAVLITILTGGVISASTLGILFAISDQLRTGVFELSRIQDNLAKARKELDQTRSQKGKMETDLTSARQENSRIQRDNARVRADNLIVRGQNNRVRAENSRIRGENLTIRSENATIKTENARIAAERARTESQLQAVSAQLKTVSQQEASLRQGIQQLEIERNRAIAQRDADIADRDRVIVDLASRRRELEEQRTELESAIKELSQAYRYYQYQLESLEKGKLALFRGQVLASGVVRIVTPSSARRAIDQLLWEANKSAVQLTQPGTNTANQQVIQITKVEVEQLIKQIQDGRAYVLRVLSAGNYVLGKRDIEIVASATPNEIVFRSGDVVSSIAVDPTVMTREQIRERVDLLLTASEFRGRSVGILAEGVQVGNESSYLEIGRFIDQLIQYRQPIEIQALTSEDIYTAGPLKIQLIATQDGKILFQTG